MLYVAIALLLYIAVILTIFLDDLKHISRHIVEMKISVSDLIKQNHKNNSEIINKIEEKIIMPLKINLQTLIEIWIL